MATILLRVDTEKLLVFMQIIQASLTINGMMILMPFTGLMKRSDSIAYYDCGFLMRGYLKGLTAGYWIGCEFMPLDKLRTQIELIPKKEYCPF